jgi:hypothetical protein
MIDYAAITEQLNREFACDHVRSCTTYLVTNAGSKVFRRQCRRCGELVAVLRRGDLTRAQMDAAVPHDKSLRPAWWQKWRERSEQLNAEATAREAEAKGREDAAWWSRYNAHLLSPEWRRLRVKVMERCGGICEGCGEHPVAHVHHLSYEHMGNEFLFELVGVCLACHARLHPERFRIGTTAAAQARRSLCT